MQKCGENIKKIQVDRAPKVQGHRRKAEDTSSSHYKPLKIEPVLYYCDWFVFVAKNLPWLQFYMAKINGYIESHVVAWSPSSIIIPEPLQACLTGLNSSMTLRRMSASSPSTHLSAERFPKTLNLHEMENE